MPKIPDNDLPGMWSHSDSEGGVDAPFFALPSHFVRADQEIGIWDSIANDTETSGLFADDGARVSTASIAFIARPEEGWDEWANRFDNVTYGLEEIAPDYDEWILSVAWPFDQGTQGKPEDTGQFGLWEDTENLPREEWDYYLGLLSTHDLDYHHAKFDQEKYRVGTRLWPGQELEDNLVWDTQNVNDMLWGLYPTSLKPTAARVFGKEWADEAGVVKKYLTKHKLPQGRWDLMPWSAIGKYADTDARLTKMLKLRQIWEIEHGAASWLWGEGGEFEAVFSKERRRLATSQVLYHMERRGVPYDEVASRIAADECYARRAPIEEQLPFLPTEAKAKQFFFGDGKTDKGVECLNHVPYAVTEKKGEPQLTAEILLRMVNDEIPFADLWNQWNKVDNAASMWYTGYADKIGTDGRLRCAFRQNGTRSTRFSVERLNLQAIPHDYRLSAHSILDGILTPRQIIANAVPDGWRLYELDLEQAELRVATIFAKCKTMDQMIRDGEDLHRYTTLSLFDVEPDTDEFFQWRQVGKRGNFSLCFGSGGATFRAMVSKETGIILGEEQADRIVRDWRHLYPEFGRAIDKHMWVVQRRQAKNGHGWVSAINGERRWFQQYEEAHKAFNQRVQLNLAQFGIDWMLKTDPFLTNNKELHQRAKRDGIGEPGLVMTIHDSEVLLLPDDEFGQSLAEQCAQFGRDLWVEWFPQIPGGVDFHAWEKINAA